MEESLFDWLERTRTVDTVLLWLAFLVPPLVAGLAFALRNRPAVTNHRHRWALGVLASPAVLILWKVYNLVTDRYGVDSVFGFAVNALIFLVSAVVLALAGHALQAALPAPPAAGGEPSGDLPSPEPTQPKAETQP